MNKAFYHSLILSIELQNPVRHQQVHSTAFTHVMKFTFGVTKQFSKSLIIYLFLLFLDVSIIARWNSFNSFLVLKYCDLHFCKKKQQNKQFASKYQTIFTYINDCRRNHMKDCINYNTSKALQRCMTLSHNVCRLVWQGDVYWRQEIHNSSCHYCGCAVWGYVKMSPIPAIKWWNVDRFACICNEWVMHAECIQGPKSLPHTLM